MPGTVTVVAVVVAVALLVFTTMLYAPRTAKEAEPPYRDENQSIGSYLCPCIDGSICETIASGARACKVATNANRNALENGFSTCDTSLFVDNNLRPKGATGLWSAEACLDDAATAVTAYPDPQFRGVAKRLAVGSHPNLDIQSVLVHPGYEARVYKTTTTDDPVVLVAGKHKILDGGAHSVIVAELVP